MNRLLYTLLLGTSLISMPSIFSVAVSPVQAAGVEDEDLPSLVKLARRSIANSYAPQNVPDFLDKIEGLWGPKDMGPILEEMRPEDRGGLFKTIEEMSAEERAQHTSLIQAFFEVMMKDEITGLNLSLTKIGKIQGQHRILGGRNFDFTTFLTPDFFNLNWERDRYFGISIDMAEWLTDSALPFLSSLRDLPVTHLRVRGIEGDKESSLQRFFQSGWESLVSLNLAGNGIGAGGARVLAGSETLRNLRELKIGDNGIGVEGARALAESETLKKLRVLNLRANRIGAEGTRALAGSETLKNLQALSLAHNEIGDGGATVLAESQVLKNLRELNVWGNLISAEGTIALAGSEALRNLRELNIGDNGIGVEGARALAGSETLKNLQVLNLQSNRIGDDGATALAGSETLKNLQVLNLQANGIGDDGATVLAESETLKNLRVLDLRGNRIGVDGARALAESQTLKNTDVIDEW